MYNRKLYNKVLIKMAKKGTRVVVTLECTEARQIESLSDPSCFKTDNTFPKTTPFTFFEQSSNDSTSNPPIDNFSERSSGVEVISTKFFNQF